MLQTIHFLSFRRRAVRLLALGLLAVALQALAGTGLLRPGTSAGIGEKFAAEVCTSHGVVKLDPAQTGDGSSLPATGLHDCCKLCAAGAPLLIAGIGIGVPPAPTFIPGNDSPDSAPPTLAVRTAHPPRGPPARA